MKRSYNLRRTSCRTCATRKGSGDHKKQHERIITLAVVLDQDLNANAALSIASLVSATPISGTTPRKSSLAGSEAHSRSLPKHERCIDERKEQPFAQGELRTGNSYSRAVIRINPFPSNESLVSNESVIFETKLYT